MKENNMNKVKGFDISEFSSKFKGLQSSPFNFTCREIQSIIMLTSDINYKTISQRLSVSESTVRQFVKNCRHKTSCNTNEAMVLLLSEYLNMY